MKIIPSNICNFFGLCLYKYSHCLFISLLGTSGRSQAAYSSKIAKRKNTVEMRDKVQIQGAFSASAHERSAETPGTSSALEVCATSLHLQNDGDFEE